MAKAIAQGLARIGAMVVIVGWDDYKTFQVVLEIREAGGNKNVVSPK